jgi:hypothetical protein
VLDVLEILNRARAARGLPPATTHEVTTAPREWLRIFHVADFDRALTVYRQGTILRYSETIQGYTKSTFALGFDQAGKRYPTLAECQRNQS